MSDWKAKRFWDKANVVEVEDGFTVLLDARNLRTPAKALLVMPTEKMALAVADEWDAQTEQINPETMPITRSANAAIDKVAVQHGEVAELIAAYGDSDLLCYRADAPVELVLRQRQSWDPVLDWAAGKLDAKLAPRTGVIHAPQDADAIVSLKAQVLRFDAFELTAFHDLVSISGSLILGFAVVHEHLSSARAWDISQLDENWQIEHWGADDDATNLAETKRISFENAERFFRLAK